MDLDTEVRSKRVKWAGHSFKREEGPTLNKLLKSKAEACQVDQLLLDSKRLGRSDKLAQARDGAYNIVNN